MSKCALGAFLREMKCAFSVVKCAFSVVKCAHTRALATWNERRNEMRTEI